MPAAHSCMSGLGLHRLGMQLCTPLCLILQVLVLCLEQRLSAVIGIHWRPCLVSCMIARAMLA